MYATTRIRHTLSRLKKTANRGFTLVELLIVIAIIGILTTIGVTNFQSARMRARDTKRKSDLVTIAKSLEAYANDHKLFPTSSGGKILCQPATATVCDWGEPFTDASGTIYAAKLPEEGRDNYYYVYESADGESFSLYARLENEQDSAIDNTLTTECSTGINCNYKHNSTNIE